MFEKILIPLDGSNLAEAALPYGEYLGGIFGSEVTLLHVCGRECRNHENMHKLYLDSLAETVKPISVDIGTQRANFKMTTTTIEGNPLDAIEQFVEKQSVNLIILTRKTNSRDKVNKLGSVADHISRTIKKPILLIKSPPIAGQIKKEPSIQRILVPLDGSDISKLALPFAEELAKKLSIPVTLYQMARNMYPFYGEPAALVDYEKMTEDEIKKVGTEMSAISEELKNKGQNVEWQVTSGNDAANEIIELSKKLENGIVIMSTHGRSGISRWALGSVAEKVLHQIEAPILLIPARAGSIN